MSTDLDPDLIEKDPDRIRHIFSDIASHYDIANTLLTGGTDFVWRHLTALELVRALRPRMRRGRLQDPPYLLDACAGSLKLGTQIRHQLNGRGRLVGTDFCIPLLKQGHADESDPGIDRVGGDVLRTPFRENAFDVCSIGFGYRNLEDRVDGLMELHRVLRPGGLLAILEFHIPPPSFLQSLYLFYFDNVLPALGALICGTDTGAYNYLNESVHDFPEPDELMDEFAEGGFQTVRHRPMMMGAVHLYILSNEGGKRGSISRDGVME